MNAETLLKDVKEKVPSYQRPGGQKILDHGLHSDNFIIVQKVPIVAETQKSEENQGQTSGEANSGQA